MNHNHIKGFTSTRIDRFSAPYMRLPEDRKRTCSLGITLNPEGIGWNHDATGARRFWPVNVTRIDRDAVAAAREQMFAEAVVAFKDGENVVGRGPAGWRIHRAAEQHLRLRHLGRYRDSSPSRRVVGVRAWRASACAHCRAKRVHVD
jgi:predicted P-loop ATPase